MLSRTYVKRVPQDTNKLTQQCACHVMLMCPRSQAVPPKLSLSSEGLNAYMASLQEKRRLLDERRRAAERRKQVGNAHCLCAC